MLWGGRSLLEFVPDGEITYTTALETSTKAAWNTSGRKPKHVNKKETRKLSQRSDLSSHLTTWMHGFKAPVDMQPLFGWREVLGLRCKRKKKLPTWSSWFLSGTGEEVPMAIKKVKSGEASYTPLIMKQRFICIKWHLKTPPVNLVCPCLGNQRETKTWNSLRNPKPKIKNAWSLIRLAVLHFYYISGNPSLKYKQKIWWGNRDAHGASSISKCKTTWGNT